MTHNRRITLLEEILALTNAAKDAARIEHDKVLNPALHKREKLIADLLGFDSSRPLPPHGTVKSPGPSNTMKSRESKALLKHICDSQGLLEQALEVRLNRLRGEEKLIHQGERYFRGLREIVSLKRGKLLDRQG